MSTRYVEKAAAKIESRSGLFSITSLCALVRYPSHFPMLNLLFTNLMAANASAATIIVLPVSCDNNPTGKLPQNRTVLHKSV